MRLLHKAVVSVFIKEDENLDLIKEKLLSLVPFSLEDEKIGLKETTAVGFKQKKIKILEVTMTKTKHLNKSLTFLLSKLSEDQKRILRDQKESRVDEQLHFFIRLDKDALLNDRFELTDSGDCFHINLRLAVFPAKRTIALAIIEKVFV